MRPVRIRIVVVLPAPLGPRKPYTTPVGTRRSSPSRATWDPYSLGQALASRAPPRDLPSPSPSPRTCCVRTSVDRVRPRTNDSPARMTESADGGDGIGRVHYKPSAWHTSADPRGIRPPERRQANNRRAVVTDRHLSRPLGWYRHPAPDRPRRSPSPAQRLPTRAPAAAPCLPPTATTPTVALPHAWRSGREEARRLPDSDTRRPAGVCQEDPVAADRRLRRSRLIVTAMTRHGPGGPGRDPQGRHRRRSRRLRHRRLQATAPTSSPTRLAATAPRWSRVYSPYATWSRVHDAAQGANVLIYLGHGNGWPSPYHPFADDVQGRHGPERERGPRQLEHEVLRRVLHGASWASRRTPWSCSTACATRRATTSGAPATRPERPPRSASTTTAYGFLKAGAQAVFASGITDVGYVLQGLFTGSGSMSMSDLFWTDPTRTVSTTRSASTRSGSAASRRAMDPYKRPPLLPVGDRPPRARRSGDWRSRLTPRGPRGHANGAGREAGAVVDSRRLGRGGGRRSRRRRDRSGSPRNRDQATTAASRATAPPIANTTRIPMTSARMPARPSSRSTPSGSRR